MRSLAIACQCRAAGLVGRVFSKTTLHASDQLVVMGWMYDCGYRACDFFRMQPHHVESRFAPCPKLPQHAPLFYFQTRTRTCAPKHTHTTHSHHTRTSRTHTTHAHHWTWYNVQGSCCWHWHGSCPGVTLFCTCLPSWHSNVSRTSLPKYHFQELRFHGIFPPL